jgi:hypothetical protein
MQAIFGRRMTRFFEYTAIIVLFLVLSVLHLHISVLANLKIHDLILLRRRERDSTLLIIVVGRTLDTVSALAFDRT